MMNDLHTPQILLFSEQEEPQSYEIYVYGTDDLVEQHKDSFCLALCRYLDEIHISQKTLARLTGIAPSTLCMHCHVIRISEKQIRTSSWRILTAVRSITVIR